MRTSAVLEVFGLTLSPDEGVYVLPCGRGTGGSGLRIVEPPDEEPRMRTSSRGDVASVPGAGSAALQMGKVLSAQRHSHARD